MEAESIIKTIVDCMIMLNDVPRFVKVSLITQLIYYFLINCFWDLIQT